MSFIRDQFGSSSSTKTNILTDNDDDNHNHQPGLQQQEEKVLDSGWTWSARRRCRWCCSEQEKLSQQKPLWHQRL